jgi:uncharacterized protein
MTRETAFAAVRLGMEDKKTSGLLFYGGEPLVEKELIYDIVDYSMKIKQQTGHNFSYKITTNGILLDEEFLKFSRKINMPIGFSHDGLAQNDCRLFPGGGTTFDLLEEKIPLLLKYQPYATAMSVMDPSTVHKASAAVKFLFEKGFRYITLSLNYSKTAPWTKKHLSVLEREYKKMAKMYIEWTKAEEKFYLSPFEMKILSHLKGEKYNEDRRRMSREQPSVAPDGKIYSGSRYVDQGVFEIGNVFSGIDSEKRRFIYEKGGTPPALCSECSLKTRCNYVYDSLSCTEAGIVSEISPVQCAHERMITPIADKIAEKLYSERNALFIHKHYNELYPVMSLVEDKIGNNQPRIY